MKAQALDPVGFCFEFSQHSGLHRCSGAARHGRQELATFLESTGIEERV